jgi:hypothetical protein
MPGDARQLPHRDAVDEVLGRSTGRSACSGRAYRQELTLFLLYHEPTSVVLAEDLYAWVEYDQLRTYRPV